MRPKFEVGEEVILQSIDFPECNGEYSVQEVSYFDAVGFCYRLDLDHKVVGRLDLWVESSLRKKHKPSRMSFDDLMSSLKTTSHV